MNTSPGHKLQREGTLNKVHRRFLLVRQATPSSLMENEIPPPSFVQGSIDMIKSKPLYWLLLVVPIAFAAAPLGLNPAWVFTLCCIGILPLAGLLGDATEQVALHTNETLGGLLNATFGNATELIVCFFALQQGLLNVVQVSLLGSILSNTLLVLGCSCVAGGIMCGPQVKFNVVAAQANTTLLQIAILGLIIPTAMESVGQLVPHGSVDLQLSRTISCLLLLLYGMYVYFQLFTHRQLFETGVPVKAEADVGSASEEEERPLLSLRGGLLWLTGATVAIAFMSESLTGSIEAAAESFKLSQTFVGFVIIPIIGNAAEHSTAIVMAAKGKMDLAFGVALGSSTQIALFVVPTMVLIGWLIGQPLDLYFGIYETVITFLSALIVSHVVPDGETNWLEGMMLLMSYTIICYAFFFYHSDTGHTISVT